MGLLADRVVVVTGAAAEGSIGEAIALRCAEEGATTLLTSRKADAAEAAAARMRKLGLKVEGAPLDLASETSIEAFSRALHARYGAVHGVVHNAGFPVTEWARGFLEVDVAEYTRVFDVDVVGAIRLTRALLPSMAERGQGSLVFTSSSAAIAGYEHLHEFAPAKAGLLGLMRGLAAEYGRKGVRSNAVAYGNISSPATYDALTPELREALASESPMKRWGSPREAAGASVFLLSDLASFVNGQVILVDGGTVTR